MGLGRLQGAGASVLARGGAPDFALKGFVIALAVGCGAHVSTGTFVCGKWASTTVPVEAHFFPVVCGDRSSGASHGRFMLFGWALVI